MNRPLPLIAGLLGVLFLAIAAMYWFVPAGGLPSFFPGFKPDSTHIAVKHAIGSLIIALVLFALRLLWSQAKAPRVTYSGIRPTRFGPEPRMRLWTASGNSVSRRYKE